jgi:hypothetical protein
LGIIVWAYRSDAAWFDGHVLPNYCPLSTSTLALETVARWTAAGLGAAVLFFVRPRLARRVAQAQVSWRAAASVAVAVVFALVVCDLFLRRKEAPRRLENEPLLPPMRIDETGNFAPLPSSVREWNVEGRVIRYETDAFGNRSAHTSSVADPSLPTVLFTGESIALGLGVDYEHGYPALVGRALGVQSVDVAVTGFSLDQAYLRLREFLARFERPVAVVTMVLPAQLERTVDDRRQRLALDREGRLELVPRSASPLLTSPLRKLVPYHSDEALALARAIVRATDEVARARGSRALFVFTNFGPPCIAEADGVSRLERTLFFGLDVSHVRVDVSPETMIRPPRELHPNEKGHLAIAQAVVGALGGQDVAKP